MSTFNAVMESVLSFCLDLGLRATVILAVTCLLALALRNVSASIRRAVWIGGLTTVVVLPALMLFGPRLTFELPREQVSRSSLPATASVAEPVVISATDSEFQRSRPTDRVERPFTAATPTTDTQSQSVTDQSADRSSVMDVETVNWALIIVCGITMGVVWRLGRISYSALCIRRLLNSATSVEHADWIADWSNACNHMGLSRPVPLREAAANIAPMTCGLLRATVLFPKIARQWSEDRRRAVMLHELAHVRHRDVAAIFLSQIACSIYFFHPLAWYAARQLRHECERTCDDRVLNAGYRAADYASHLTAIARTLASSQCPTVLAVAMSQSSNIERRICAILNERQRRSRPGRASGILSVACSVCVGIALTAPQFSEANAETAASTQEGAEQESKADPRADRNNVFRVDETPLTWNMETGKNVRWSSRLGSVTFSSPVVAEGRVFIGTNNEGEYVKRLEKTKDLGCLLAFDAETGQFLWQYSAEKMDTGRVNDWPKFGITASPYADSGRVWIVNNRSEVVCLDAEGFHDNDNDGSIQNEVVADDEADVIWSVSLIEKIGSFPHNHSDCTITSDGKLLFIVVPNGVDATHRKLPGRNAPAFVALERDTGKLVWTSTTSEGIMHGQWSSAALATVNGRTQVICPGGDGWLYGLNAEDGATIWKFHCNPRDATWKLGGRGRRNNLIGMPLVYDGLVYIATGQEWEHGDGPGDLWCIAPSGKGVSPQIVNNPNGKVVWHFNGLRQNDAGQQAHESIFHRSMSTPVAKDGLLIVADYKGLVHCFDAKTGKRHWVHDLLGRCWSSPVIVNDHVYVADEDGEVAILGLSEQKELVAEITMDNSIYSTPTVANNVLFVASRKTLIAVHTTTKSGNKLPRDALPSDANNQPATTQLQHDSDDEESENANADATHTWSSISYPDVKCRFASGTASALFSAVDQPDAKGLRFSLGFGWPKAAEKEEGFVAPDGSKIRLRLHFADGSIVAPQHSDFDKPFPRWSHTGRNWHGRFSCFFPWGKNQMQEAWLELTFPERSYWLEIPYGFTRDPSSAKLPASKSGRPKLAPAMKTLPKNAQIVNWKGVFYKIGEVKNDFWVSLQHSNPFDAHSQISLGREVATRRWSLNSPRTSVSIRRKNGNTLKSRAVGIRLSESDSYRTDSFNFNRDSGSTLR